MQRQLKLLARRERGGVLNVSRIEIGDDSQDSLVLFFLQFLFRFLCCESSGLTRLSVAGNDSGLVSGVAGTSCACKKDVEVKRTNAMIHFPKVHFLALAKVHEYFST